MRGAPTAPVDRSCRETRTLECGRSRFKLLGCCAGRFSDFPSFRFNQGLGESGQGAQQHLATSFAVRPRKAVRLKECSGEPSRRMRMVDTNTLAKMEIGIVRNAPSSDLIVAKGTRQSSSSPRRRSSRSHGDNHIGFRRRTSGFTRPYRGTVPNYEQVIPKRQGQIAIADSCPYRRSQRCRIASDHTHRIPLLQPGFAQSGADSGAGRARTSFPSPSPVDQSHGFTEYLLAILRIYRAMSSHDFSKRPSCATWSGRVANPRRQCPRDATAPGDYARTVCGRCVN